MIAFTFCSGLMIKNSMLCFADIFSVAFVHVDAISVSLQAYAFDVFVNRPDSSW